MVYMILPGQPSLWWLAGSYGDGVIVLSLRMDL